MTPNLAQVLLKRDEKINKQYNKLFRRIVKDMRTGDHIRRATYLLWVGHNLERIGDRACNIAERVVFTVTGEYIEILDEMDDEVDGELDEIDAVIDAINSTEDTDDTAVLPD